MYKTLSSASSTTNKQPQRKKEPEGHNLKYVFVALNERHFMNFGSSYSTLRFLNKH